MKYGESEPRLFAEQRRCSPIPPSLTLLHDDAKKIIYGPIVTLREL
jgi:hypothetical protein